MSNSTYPQLQNIIRTVNSTYSAIMDMRLDGITRQRTQTMLPGVGGDDPDASIVDINHERHTLIQGQSRYALICVRIFPFCARSVNFTSPYVDIQNRKELLLSQSGFIKRNVTIIGYSCSRLTITCSPQGR